eukprot:468683_1
MTHSSKQQNVAISAEVSSLRSELDSKMNLDAEVEEIRKKCAELGENYTLNLASRVTRTNYHRLIHHTKLSARYLEGVCIADTAPSVETNEERTHESQCAECEVLPEADGLELAFEYLFMTPMKFSDVFDGYLRVDITQVPGPSQPHDLSRYSNALRSVCGVLTQGFTDRARLLAVQDQALGSWDLGSVAQEWPGAHVMVGLMFDPSQARRLLDVGPTADDAAASKRFRGFWGKRSELRRFKDGSIVEAVFWGSDAAKHQHHHIIALLSKYGLQRHLHIPPEYVSFVGTQFDSVLLAGNRSTLADSQAALSAFGLLKGHLRELKKIPLMILSIEATHPALRHCGVFPPRPIDWDLVKPQNPSDSVEPIEVVVEFEAHNKWPEDFNAIQRIKTAFYVKFAESLQNQFSIPSAMAADFLDVFVDDFAFRLRIQYQH